MKKTLKSALQVLFSLALGFFLIWIIYRDLTEEDKTNMINAIRGANYWWIAASTVVAIFSHVFRAYRWKFPLETLGIHINMANRFSAVMIGYLANLAFPRLGEVTRCAVLTRYQKQPFEKLFGTVIAERVIDAVILLLLIALAILMQYSILESLILDSTNRLIGKSNLFAILIVGGLIGLLALFLIWKFISRSTHQLALRIKDKLMGLVDGFATIKRMNNPLGFYFYTVLIWGSYVLMFVLTFKSLPETAGVPFGGMLASFVLGGLSIVAVQGGLGAYPLAIMVILALYGVESTVGYTFGWIVWSAQTVMIIVGGFIAMVVMPLLNKTPEPKHTA